MLKITFDELFPVREKDDFFHENFTQSKILLGILPEKLRLVDGIDFIADAVKQDKRTKLSNFYKKGEPLEKAKAIAHNISVHYSVECGNGTSGFFDTNMGKDLVNRTASILDCLSPDALCMYTEHIKCLLDDIEASNDNYLYEINGRSIVDGIKHMEVYDKIARLVIIASTWSLWEQYSDIGIKPLIDSLVRVIVPKSYFDKNSSSLNSNVNKLEDQAAARAMLTRAEKDYSEGGFKSCVAECSKILSVFSAEDDVRGKAYYLLLKCVEEHECSYNEYYDPKEFMKLSIESGCKEAAAEWSLSHIDSLIYTSSRGTKPIHSPDRIIYNSQNAVSAAFLSSVPQDYISENRMAYAENAAELLSEIHSDNSTLILLADDDLQLNFSQFIRLLDFIHISDSARSAVGAVFTVYLRTDENRYSSLIDIALKYVGDRRIRVYLLDDCKAATQTLLNRHPLFYPIQSFSSDALNTVETHLNYMVVTDDANELTEWLIREAFWMGCFSYRSLVLNITVLSPYADKLESVVKGKYPGMFTGLEKLDDISKVNFSFKSIIDVESDKLENELDALDGINSYYYCVIALKDPFSGLELSKRVREWSIRKKLRSNADMIGVADLPIIAFYCTDDNIAHLSGMISVQSIDKGNSWYNNYRLIPFGMPGKLYNWNNLFGNTIEETAGCVHLQYCGVDTDADRRVIEKELESFYYRVYNRDSSIAVAVSLPYRLFHMPYKDQAMGISTDHIVPRGWSILNDSAYTDIQSVNRMANMFKQGLNNESTVKQLTTYEHARWARWALSRGWIPATPSEAVSYMMSGNPKQQLFIARMHACICSVEDLTLLQKTLYEELTDERGDNYAPSGANEDIYDRFINMDKRSIESTPDLLIRSWLHSSNTKHTADERID